MLQIVRPWLGITWTKMIGSFYGIFKRYLLESEETNLFALLDTLQQVYIPERGKIAGCGQDSRVWTPSWDGEFPLSSFFEALSTSSPKNSHWKRLWKSKAPPRVLAFAWLAFRGSILGLNNHRRRNMIVVNACLMCLEAEKCGPPST